MYTDAEILGVLNKLLSLPSESEIVEFKKAQNTFSDVDLGRYFSALSNEANLLGQKNAWLVFGVDDKTHKICGTNYKSSASALDELKKKIADQINDRITFEQIYSISTPEGRVILFQIPAAPRGIPVSYQGHYYGRDGESLGSLNISEIERIRNQAVYSDWSKEIVPDATIEDLDSLAIQKAREKYLEKHPEKKEELQGWDDITFLNKAKITIRGKVTNAAIVLLGKEESEVLISPSVAQI